jgi:seryl-tRNA synthetase
MNEDFIFRLGADVSSFTKSITEVEKELDSARKAIKGALGDDLVKGNQYVQELEQSLKNLKATGLEVSGTKNAADAINNVAKASKEAENAIDGVGKSLKSLPKANIEVTGAGKAANEIKNISPVAQKAQNTLTGLSGVVRDLPFGFIAIQNNLPILIDQFSSLSKTSGGVGGALKGLGGALVGPAGAAFAFGAVVSVVTGLVQKYGSLSSAINEVLVLSKSQKDLQNELSVSIGKTVGDAQSEITTLNNLTNILTNTNSTLNQRNGAYEELNQKYPGLLSNLSQEEIASGKVNSVIAGRIALFAKEIELNGKRKALEGLIAKEAEKSYTSLSQLANQSFLDGLTAELQGVLLGFNSGTAGLQVFAQQTQNGAKATQFFEGVLKGVQGELSETEGAIKQLTDAEKKRKKEEEEKAKKIQENAAKEKSIAAKKLAQQKALNAAIEREKKALEEVQKQRTIRVTAQLDVDFQRRGNIDTSEILKKRIQETQKEVERTAGAIQIPLKFPAVNPLALLQNLKLAQAEFQKLKEAANLQATTQLITDTFFNPLAGLFEGLISGAKNSMQEFGKAITSALKQLVAKIIATGIIQIIGVLLSGGFSAAAGGAAGGFKSVLKGIGAAFGFKFETNDLKNVFDFAGIANGLQNAINSVNTSLAFQGSLSGVANPNFGGVTGGGMAMSGAVNVVLRGQDLVGSLNRTNAQINRVG